MLTPAMIRPQIRDPAQQSISITSVTPVTENQLYELLVAVAAAPNEKDARNLLL
jgi:hypothetical protein